MDVLALTRRVGTVVMLSFVDGEQVEALLLGIDVARDKDLTYEVRRVLERATPPTKGTEIGATLIAALSDLTGWSDPDSHMTTG